MSEEIIDNLKETKEFVRASIDLCKVISSELSDGYQKEDLIQLAKKIATDSSFREVLWDGIKGIQNIPEEVKASNPGEIALELGSIVLDALKK